MRSAMKEEFTVRRSPAYRLSLEELRKRYVDRVWAVPIMERCLDHGPVPSATDRFHAHPRG